MMNAKILVVDDEALILSTIERALVKVGYTVMTAQDMRAVDLALADAPFDLLISDIHLGEDSVENIVERVKHISPSVKVLLMSGSVSRGPQDDFIEKPFKIADLRNKVRDILNEPS